jgi:AAA family ATP:ADP antiporter
MNNKLTDMLISFISPDKYERLKVLLLSLTFLLVIAAYTIIYDMKSSIFMSIVGREYVPLAKMISMVALVPAILFYSLLVDKIRRYQLLYFYSITYGIIGLCCTYLIGHPTIGLLNTDSSPFRLFGWFFFIFVEGFPSFVVSVFWAFSNSVNTPEGAQNNYGILVSASKLGGILSAGIAWWFLTLRDIHGNRIFSDVINHQILLLIFSVFILLVPIVIYFLMKRVPGNYLHGYEAVYQFEKEKEAEPEKVGMFAGLIMILKRPYILGIFGMLFFYEVLNTILSYQRLGVAESASHSVSDISYLLYQQMFAMHFIGFFISIIGTRNLLRWFGERVCLLLIPLTSGALLFYFWFTYTPFSLLLVFVALKSVNYAFAAPVRESLYIPTIKDIKFKSKSWIDSFGSKFARTFGSCFNSIIDHVGTSLYFPIHAALFLGVIGAWLATSILVGKRYVLAIKRNEVIGG